MRRNANCVFFFGSDSQLFINKHRSLPSQRDEAIRRALRGRAPAPPPRGETDGNEDKEGDLGGASASGSVEAPPSLVGQRCVIDRLFSDGKKKRKKILSKELLAR